MKHIDQVRGFERMILMGDGTGHRISGGNPLTGCVVESVETDFQGRCPVLSLRFYVKPTYSHEFATGSAERGRPLYDADTPIGTQIDLGPEMAQSLIEQINSKWPEFLEHIKADSEDDQQST